jgi:hypothetical protein
MTRVQNWKLSLRDSSYKDDETQQKDDCILVLYVVLNVLNILC